MSVQGGVLYFNKSASQYVPKTQVRGNGNQHDESKGVDLKINQEYVRNGVDNFFPFDIEGVVKRSMLQKRAFRTITNIINGKLVWQNPDGSPVTPQRQQELTQMYTDIGLTKHNVIKPLIQSNYLQGGSFVTMQWESDGLQFVPSNVAVRQYKTGRLSFPTWDKVKYVYPRHYYHRSWGYKYEKEVQKKKNMRISVDTLSWLDWNSDPVKNFDNACYINEYNLSLDRNRPVNRLQSIMIGDFDGLSDHYPQPVWFTGTTYNYERSEFFLSCFDVDDIENGLHASGIVKVYHKSYIDPESSEAKNTFESHQQMIESKLRGSYNSGSVVVVPVGLDANGDFKPTEDYMEFEPIKTSNTKERHEIFDSRIINKVLGANGVIMPELLGIRDEKSTLSESGTKLLNAVKLLNQFTIKEQKSLLDDPESGFLNAIVNFELGIEEKVVLVPNMAAFLTINENLAKHFLHPDQWFEMYQDFGLTKPTIEQIESELIPAYILKNGSMNKITIE